MRHDPRPGPFRRSPKTPSTVDWRRAAWTAACLAFLTVGCSEPPAPGHRELAGAAAGRNVLLLSVDTVRADRLGAYGYTARTTSPRIDALLASGVLFEEASAPRAITWASLASVLSGLYPSGHGVTENGYSFPDGLAMLPLELQAAGYQTAAFLSNMCQANHQGWDAFRCSPGVDGKTVRWALEWLADEREPGKPVFLWMHLFAAHPPYYNGGDRADRELDPGYDGPLAAKKKLMERLMREQRELDEADLHHLEAIYDAAVMGTDGLVGRFLDGYAAEIPLEESVVIFLADHGEDLYQHNGYIFHSCSVYQSGLHVPLAFAAPGLLPAGGRVAPPVELIDVAPTLLELLGITAEDAKHGTSLLAYLERPDARGDGKPAFSEFGDTRLHTVRAGPWKLVHNPDAFSPVCLAEAPEDHYPIAERELYNLAEDPGETKNLAAREPHRVVELTGRIESRFAQLERRGGEQEIPEELKKELESLGYLAP